MQQIFLETQRMFLRRIAPSDFSELCVMLQDKDVMYAWEHTFTDDEVREWIDRRLAQYDADGYSYFLAVDKQSGQVIGQMGLLHEEINGESCTGVGWILNKACWHMGYATEGAKALINYAVSCLNCAYVVADIRPENQSSRRVAERLSMKCTGEFIKHYHGRYMKHLIYTYAKEP